MVESGVLAFEALRPGDVLRHPDGGEIEIVSMGPAGRMDGAPAGRLDERPLLLGASLGTFTASYQAQLQTKINSLGPQAAALLRQQTGVDVNDARVQKGAAATLDLATHGFDPNSKADEDKLITAIAGGLALIVPVGTALAASLEGLYQLSGALACPMMQLAETLGLGRRSPACGGQPCVSTGNWTTASVLSSNAPTLPTLRTGTFADFVVGALAAAAASAGNCQATMPPGILVDAAVMIWNETHQGPAEQILVPPLAQTNKGLTAFQTSPLITAWTSITGSRGQALRAGKDPYVYYAFGRVIDIDPGDAPNYSTQPSGAGPWQPWGVAPYPPLVDATTPFGSGSLTVSASTDPPRVVMVHTGPPLKPLATMTIPGAPPQVTSFEPGKVYLVFTTVSGADGSTGQPLAGQTVMDEATFLGFVQKLVGFPDAQVLWWGPTKTTNDPAGYLTKGWLAEIFALGQALHAVAGRLFMLGTFHGTAQAVVSGTTAWDVTGLMTPTVAAPSAPLSTGAKVAIGAGAITAAAGGGLWLALGRPASWALFQAALGKLLDRVF